MKIKSIYIIAVFLLGSIIGVGVSNVIFLKRNQEFSYRMNLSRVIIGQFAAKGDNNAIVNITKKVIETEICNDHNGYYKKNPESRSFMINRIIGFYLFIEEPLPESVKRWMNNTPTLAE